jgi:hypothetical protein
MSFAVERAMAPEDVALASILIAGAAHRCRFHSDCVITNGDPDADRRAYASATNRWKNGDVICDREDVLDAVEGALETTDDECAQCVK